MTTESTPAKVRLSDQLGHANEVQPLVDRLRGGYTDWNGDSMDRRAPPMDCLTAGDVLDAVDEIKRLRAAIEMACNALAPGGLYAGVHSQLTAALKA